MIWRWLTSSRVAPLGALAIVLTIAAELQAAAISGSVVLRDSRSDSVNKRKDYSGVVVSAEPVGGEPPDAPSQHAVMRQKDKTFSPHVLPIVIGTQVDFPNFDPIFHNAFSSYNGQIFDVGLYPPGKVKTVRFARRPGVVRVFCNIHPSMSAIILVLNTSYFTQTRNDGGFTLEVPPGEYQLNVFHERATEPTLEALSRRIVVGSDQPVHTGEIVVSEAGYLAAPHKNKYGHDYNPPPDDQVYYPALRK
jgi:plastocyanin